MWHDIDQTTPPTRQKYFCPFTTNCSLSNTNQMVAKKKTPGIHAYKEFSTIKKLNQFCPIDQFFRTYSYLISPFFNSE